MEKASFNFFFAAWVKAYPKSNALKITENVLILVIFAI